MAFTIEGNLAQFIIEDEKDPLVLLYSKLQFLYHVSSNLLTCFIFHGGSVALQIFCEEGGCAIEIQDLDSIEAIFILLQVAPSWYEKAAGSSL